nr:AMP-binding protein [Burkholderiales bacterium]
WWALNALGVSVVPLPADARTAELAWVLEHSDATRVVAIAARHALLAKALPRIDRVVPVIAPDHRGAMPSPIHAAPQADRAPDRATECALLYTSGTTGRPKGCVLSNDYFLHAARWYVSVGDLATLRVDVERIATPLPLSHMNAMAFSTMAALATGGCIVQMDRFHPATWLASVRYAGATVVHTLGVMPAMLLARAPSREERAHAIRFGFSPGLDPAHHAAFEQRYGFPLLEAWAMTETGAGGITIAAREPRHVGTRCIGPIDAAVDACIVDADGVPVTDGNAGELRVRARGADPRRGFFTHYLKDRHATEAAWADGWFHTGDTVRRGPDGQLHFVDRRQNVIRRSGENIAAIEVESTLVRHPQVASCAVAATPDELRGDEVIAFVVLRAPIAAAERAALAAALVTWTLQELAYFKAPGWVAFVDTLPVTASQKLSRAELATLAREAPRQPYCVDVRMLKKRSEP